MRENLKYSLFQGFYYTGFCTGQGFCTYYLSKFGYSFHTIGIITALSCFIASILQIIFGRVLDRSKKLNWKNTLIAFIFIYEIAVLVLYFTKDKIITGIFLGLSIMLINAMMPMINSISFYYEKIGKKVNFGFARGIGSLAFAICSVMLGRLTMSYGEKMVPLLAIFMTVFMFLFLISMPYDKKYDKENNTKEFLNKNKSKKENLLKKYPAFFVMFAGVTLFYTFHNMYCTYLITIVEDAGGNTKDYGIAMAMAAVLEIPIMFSSSKLVKKIKSSILLIICGFAFSLKGIIFLFAENMTMVYTAQALQMFSYALIAPVTVYFADECMRSEDKVTGQSVMAMAIAIGSVLGNLLGALFMFLFNIKILLMFGLCISFVGIIFAFVSFYMLKEEKYQLN